MSRGNLSTQLDRPYAQQDHVRAAAIRFLERTGNTDLLDMLGLAAPPRGPGERPDCPLCGRPRQRAKNAGWKPCKRKLCAGEPES